MSGELPGLVERYLARALPTGPSPASVVRVRQVGEMWQKPGGRAMRFEAVEEFTVAEVAFTWRARFPLGPLSINVVDRYRDGAGLLEARVLGVPVMRQRGQETAEGEAMRYLAEIPWVPHAIKANRQLDWSDVDERTVEVATKVGPGRVAVRLEFDPDGDIVRAYTDARPHLEGKAIVPRPWGGVFSDYAVVGGIRLPTRAEVSWQLPAGPFTYWRGEITAAETR